MRLLVAIVASTALIVASTGVSSEAEAAIGIEVTTVADVVDPNDGICSLREAITAANSDLPSGLASGECASGMQASADTIDVQVAGAILLNGTELPTITEDVNILGNGINVNARELSRVLEISGAIVTLDDIALLRGNASTDGGGLRISGASIVEFTQVTIADSTTTGEGGGVAIMQGSTLMASDSQIRDNTGRSGGLAVVDVSSAAELSTSIVTGNVGVGNGGGIVNHGTLTVSHSTIDSNRSNSTDGTGGVSQSSTGSAVISDSSISSNIAGGFLGKGAAAGGSYLELRRTTVTANNSTRQTISAAASTLLINSTISGNDPGNNEATIEAHAQNSVTILFSTITDNSGRGLNLDGQGSAVVGASIIAGNTSSDVSGSFFFGTFVSEGFNVIGNTFDLDGLMRFDGPHDIIGVADANLGLGPLSANGGAGLTHALLDLSPAIDRVTRPVSENPPTDQRATARPQGVAADSGAFEAVGGAAGCNGLLPTIDMNTNGGNGAGTPSDDVILGTPGADQIHSGAGDDLICGGDGDDAIRGGPGDDTIFGNGGNDLIRGGGGAELIEGGSENDEIFGQGGADVLIGGSGDDDIDGQGAPDTIQGGFGNDTLAGQNSADLIEGGWGDDSARGNSGPDTFYGDGGDDDLVGGGGADTFFGGDGHDRCSGNAGPDSAEAATCENTPGIETLF